MINEYGLEYADAEDKARRRALLRLLRRNAPLDGIGVQAHLRLDRGAIGQGALARFLEELTGRGLFVLVTELDVRESDFNLPLAERDCRVAVHVRDFLEVVLAQPAVRGVTTWGLSDRHSRLNEAGEIGTRHSGGNRGLPLDAELRQKPFFEATIAAFERAPPADLPLRDGRGATDRGSEP